MLASGGKCIWGNHPGIWPVASTVLLLRTQKNTSTLQQKIISEPYLLKDGIPDGNVGWVFLTGKVFLISLPPIKITTSLRLSHTEKVKALILSYIMKLPLLPAPTS